MSEKFFKYLHKQGLDPETIPRSQNRSMLIVLLVIYILATIAIPITYYFVNLHNEMQRVDISYRDRDFHDTATYTLTCDCAKPIVVQPSIIVNDQDYLQPDYRSCLDEAFKIYPSNVLAESLKSSIMSNIFETGTSRLERQNFNNLVINGNSDIMESIGLLLKIRYIDDVYNRITAIGTITTYEVMKWATVIAMRESNLFDEYNDTLTIQAVVGKFNTIIMGSITQCTLDHLTFDHIEPAYFVTDLTEDDCLPANCYMFVPYSWSQSTLQIIGFYLAVIGYVTMLLKWIYQQTTKEEGLSTDTSI